MNISFKSILEKAIVMSDDILNSDKHRLLLISKIPIDNYSITELAIEKENYIKLLFIKLFDIKSSIDWLIIQTNNMALNKEKIILDKIYYLIQKAPIKILEFINENFDLYKMDLIDSQMIDEIYAMRY